MGDATPTNTKRMMHHCIHTHEHTFPLSTGSSPFPSRCNGQLPLLLALLPFGGSREVVEPRSPGGSWGLCKIFSRFAPRLSYSGSILLQRIQLCLVALDQLCECMCLLEGEGKGRGRWLVKTLSSDCGTHLYVFVVELGFLLEQHLVSLLKTVDYNTATNQIRPYWV